jgi:predicted alpha/beta-hydrolase family hydrolase
VQSAPKANNAEPVTIAVGDSTAVSGLLELPRGARACLVLAHGAGAGMTHPFLEAFASHLVEQKIASLRFQFPSMERGSKRPDPPKLCHATIRAAVGEAARRTRLPLIAGGKSFGGRMTSQAQALSPLPNVRGLVLVGFPLHPPKRPAEERGAHLFDIDVPMLFLQGTRDEFADRALLEPLVHRLGRRASLHRVEGGNHSFHVPVRSGKTDSMVLAELAVAVGDWLTKTLGREPRRSQHPAGG